MSPSGLVRRLGGLISLRTLSGKLIVGLFVLFGLASAAVSLVTAQSLKSTLTSSLDGQLQAATNTWLSCVNTVYHDSYDGHNGPPGHGPGAGGQAGLTADAGQAGQGARAASRMASTAAAAWARPPGPSRSSWAAGGSCTGTTC